MDRGRNNVQTVWMNCDYVQVSWIKSSEASYVLISPPSVTQPSWVWWRGCCSRDRRHRGAGRPGVKHQVRATVTHTTKMDDFRVHPYKRVSQKPECVVIKYRKSVQATKYLVSCFLISSGALWLVDESMWEGTGSIYLSIPGCSSSSLYSVTFRLRV